MLYEQLGSKVKFDHSAQSGQKNQKKAFLIVELALNRVVHCFKRVQMASNGVLSDGSLTNGNGRTREKVAFITGVTGQV